MIVTGWYHSVAVPVGQVVAVLWLPNQVFNGLVNQWAVQLECFSF